MHNVYDIIMYIIEFLLPILQFFLKSFIIGSDTDIYRLFRKLLDLVNMQII